MCNRTELARRLLRAAIAGSLLVPVAAFAVPDWYFQSPATPVAQEIITLHDLIFWICVVIFVGVFGTMFYSLWRHRKS
ncbi:MAG TPA: cytochrome c oxidase subunit II transmembrane domain-containing protein, partial [Casimicrobiaceae bacterium]|nr:cytochrome c oxidase subunit II transmembrane domain-containing protein [Casimicrobiaceae bacterium]